MQKEIIPLKRFDKDKFHPVRKRLLNALLGPGWYEIWYDCRVPFLALPVLEFIQLQNSGGEETEKTIEGRLRKVWKTLSPDNPSFFLDAARWIQAARDWNLTGAFLVSTQTLFEAMSTSQLSPLQMVLMRVLVQS